MGGGNINKLYKRLKIVFVSIVAIAFIAFIVFYMFFINWSMPENKFISDNITSATYAGSQCNSKIEYNSVYGYQQPYLFIDYNNKTYQFGIEFENDSDTISIYKIDTRFNDVLENFCDDFIIARGTCYYDGKYLSLQINEVKKSEYSFLKNISIKYSKLL